jgi:hypothetical protein
VTPFAPITPAPPTTFGARVCPNGMSIC